MPDIWSLVAAEFAFAEMARQSSTKEAFLEFLADDALLFTQAPVPGKELIRGRPAGTTLLSWYPVWAEMSGSSALGYTTGPYRLLADRSGGPPVSTGHFVSVWQVTDGRWRVAVDGGIHFPVKTPAGPVPEVPEPPGIQVRRNTVPAATWQLCIGLRSPDNQATPSPQDVAAAEEAFSKEAREDGPLRAYSRRLAEDARVFHQGYPAASGRRDALQLIEGKGGLGGRRTLVRAVTSPANDLGYTVGVALDGGTDSGAGAETAQSFLHVWRTAPSGEWLLALELLPPG